MKRTVVCLVGRRKDWRLLREAEVAETLRGNIVLTVGCIGPDGPHTFHDEAGVERCKQLHFDKIQMADETLIVSEEIGQDTREDLLFALQHGKVIRFHNQGIEKRKAIMKACERFGFYDIYQPDDNTFYQIGH